MLLYVQSPTPELGVSGVDSFSSGGGSESQLEFIGSPSAGWNTSESSGISGHEYLSLGSELRAASAICSLVKEWLNCLEDLACLLVDD